MADFSQNVMELRRKLGWSQEELGSRLGVSRQTVSKWESGQTTPELEKLVAMAELFQISIDQLVGREEAGRENAPEIDAPSEPLPDQRDGWHPYARYVKYGGYYEYEYISRLTLFGIPLVHVKFGWDLRPAKGIVAIGNTAVGVVALGGAAVGAISLGGVSVGLLLALGGLSVGLVALGGLAVGGFALGGGAVGQWMALGGGAVSNGLAIGGGAVGHVAVGDEAVGAFAFSSGAGWSVEEVWQVIRRETPYVWSGIRGLLRYFL